MRGKILTNKTTYTQNDIINEINIRTGCSTDDIKEILKSLADVVKDKLSDCSNFIEMRLFTGLKVTSKNILPEQSRSKLMNLKNVNIDDCMTITAQLTKRFKTDIHKLHKMKMQ